MFDFLRKCDIGGKTNLAECMKDFVTQNKRRGLAVVISDFYDPVGFEQGINTLRYHKFEPFVLQTYDLREASPALHGDLTLVDCERGAIRMTPHGVMIYGEEEWREVTFPVELYTKTELDVMYRAWANDAPLEYHDGPWGRATTEVCLGILQSGRERRELPMRHQAALPSDR